MWSRHSLIEQKMTIMPVGGEMSGHMFSEGFYGFDDGATAPRRPQIVADSAEERSRLRSPTCHASSTADLVDCPDDKKFGIDRQEPRSISARNTKS